MAVLQETSVNMLAPAIFMTFLSAARHKYGTCYVHVQSINDDCTRVYLTPQNLSRKEHMERSRFMIIDFFLSKISSMFLKILKYLNLFDVFGRHLKIHNSSTNINILYIPVKFIRLYLIKQFQYSRHFHA